MAFCTSGVCSLQSRLVWLPVASLKQQGGRRIGIGTSFAVKNAMLMEVSMDGKQATLDPPDEECGDHRQKLELDWAESEWFEVWLQLARHEKPQGQEQTEG